MLQMRPSSGGRAYSPNRDLAWCMPRLVKTALDAMGETDWEAWFGDYLKHTNTSEDDLATAAAALGRSFKLMATDMEIKTPYEALEKEGFFRTSGPAQLAISAKIAQVMVGAFFVAIRDALRQDELPPADINELNKAGEELVKHFRKPGKPLVAIPVNLPTPQVVS